MNVMTIVHHLGFPAMSVVLAVIAVFLALRGVYLRTPGRLAYLPATLAALLVAQPDAIAQTGVVVGETFFSLRTLGVALFVMLAGGGLFFARCKATGSRLKTARLVYMAAIAGTGALAAFWAALEWGRVTDRAGVLVAMGAAFAGGEAVLKKLGGMAEESISSPSPIPLPKPEEGA